MAMQTGMGLSKILILVGAGYTSMILVKNGKLSDILGEIQEISLVKGMEKNEESSEFDSDVSNAITSQVRRLAMEVRQLASARQITVLNGNSGQIGNMTSLIVPAAVVGALCYGCMWWKGLTYSDLMYVTKRNMANAVSNLTKHLESNEGWKDMFTGRQTVKGLKEIGDSLVSENANRFITDGTIQEGIERLDDRPRTLMR
ncbi:unnamed protein product [Camellia sinensis]